MQRSLPSWVLSLIALSMLSCATLPNLIARGMNVKWDGTTHTTRSFVSNGNSTDSPSRQTAGEFMVYVDGEENPTSPYDIPQTRTHFDALSGGAVIEHESDFSPLASPANAQLGHVIGLVMRADPKQMVQEDNEADNVLMSPLPSSVDASTIYGPLLVPAGALFLGVDRFVGQTFTPEVGGQLVGIEITAQYFGAIAGASLQLTIKDGALMLATQSLPASNFPAGATVYPRPISGLAPGPGFFDLRASPVAMSAGHAYSFELKNVGGTYRYQIGMAPNALPGNATDYGEDIPGLDLAFRLYIRE